VRSKVGLLPFMVPPKKGLATVGAAWASCFDLVAEAARPVTWRTFRIQNIHASQNLSVLWKETWTGSEPFSDGVLVRPTDQPLVVTVPATMDVRVRGSGASTTLDSAVCDFVDG